MAMNPVDMDDNDNEMDFELERLTNEGDSPDDDDDDDSTSHSDDEDTEFYQDGGERRVERASKQGIGIMAQMQEQNITHLQSSGQSYDIAQYPPKMDAIPDHAIMMDAANNTVTPESCKLIDDSIFQQEDSGRDGSDRIFDDFSMKDGISLYGFDDSSYDHSRHGPAMRSPPSDYVAMGDVNVRFR